MLYLFLKNIRQAILMTSITLLVACSSAPVSMDLQPELSTNLLAVPLTNKTAWQLSSQDQRVAQYLIEVTKDKGAAKLVNSSQSSRSVIEKTLQQQWAMNGLKFATESANKINVKVIELLAKVKQNTVTHDTASKIVIQVDLITEQHVFSKTFRSSYSKEGAFTANTDKIGKQLNIQLAQLLSEIIQDPELNSKLQQP